MSFPDPLEDIDYAVNKKRCRAQSVEPTPAQAIDEPPNSSLESSGPNVTALKKTKRDEEDNARVKAIRKNMKDMCTTDRNLTEAAETSSSTSTNNNGSQEDADEDLDEEEEIEDEETDEPMGTIAEQEEPEQKKASVNPNPFGGNIKDQDDWGEFAEKEEETTEPATKETSNNDEKPKYTFGASSGFGTKGWAATHQTVPTPSKAPTFGGFGSSSGFGGFKSATAPSITSTSIGSNTNTTSPFEAAAAGTTSVPSFGSFAKATSSPFASAAAAGNALTSPPSNDNQFSNLPALSSTSAEINNNKDDSDNESVEDKDREGTASNDTSHTAFGEGVKVKVPGVKQQTEVKTGEEGEETLYQIKGKLLVLDAGNWKERGVGTFRINRKVPEDSQKPAQVRLVMRTDTVYRVILNLLLFEGMKIFLMQEKFVRFAGFEVEQKPDGTSGTKMVSYALRLSSPQAARELLEEINAFLPPSTTSDA